MDARKLISLMVFSAAAAISAGATDSVQAAEKPSPNAYISETDKMLTIHKIGILPATDNVDGLYSRYVEDKLAELLRASHRFDVAPVKEVDARKTVDDYESNPNIVRDIGTKSNVDALVTGRVNKLKKGLEITLDLFLTKDGQLLEQETSTSENRFAASDVEEKTKELYGEIIHKLPYRGLILSRQGNRVTIDVGTKDGVSDGAVVSVEQVISLKRHPKFHFMVGTEKEIMGKVKIVKADETLSFGVVLSEKDPGVIGPDSKITGLDYVTYSDPTAASLQPVTTSQDFSKDAVSFGKHPKEWVPPQLPSLGRISLALGLGSIRDTQQIKGTNLESGADIYPQIELMGEIWITPNWYAAADITQGVLSVNNPGTGPDRLGANNAQYDFHGGYRFLLQDDFWGPVIDTHVGLYKYSYNIEETSAMTSIDYNGLYFGFGGSAPITPDRAWYVDAYLNLFLAPYSTETPGTSGGTSSNSITKFGIGGRHRLSTQFWVDAHLTFEALNTDYTNGNGSHQQLTTLLTGVEYFF